MKNRNLIITALLIFTLISFGACRKQARKEQTANSNTTTGSEGPFGGKALTGEKFYFRGAIAGNLSIEMTLVRDGDRLTGTYFYPKVGKNITLGGTIDKAGHVALKETDEAGTATGQFKGKWTAATDAPDPGLNEITGKWSKPDGSKEVDFQVVQQPIEFTTAVRIAPKVIQDASKEKHYAIEAEYPQIDGDSRFSGFNREASVMVTKDLAAFKTTENTSSEPGAETPVENLDSTLDTRYEIRLATDDLISIEFTEAAYSSGAAHPSSATMVLNYDVTTGRKLALADLFNPKSNYLSVISAFCIKSLKEQSKKNNDSMPDEEQIKSGAAPQAENYRAWAITKKGIWITFDPYQVASYAAGPQTVLVPYAVLKDVIKPDGPVAGLAK